MAALNPPLNPHWHPDWLIPQWPAPAHVRTVFTTRAGGCSPAPWDSLNLGDHVGDAPARVADNRQTLALATGCQPVFVQQVHGQQVVELEPASAALSGLVADAVVTRQRGLGCTIMVADCLPVLLAHLDEPVVAAAHAGWRGLAGAQSPASAGVLAAVFERFSELAGQKPPPAHRLRRFLSGFPNWPDKARTKPPAAPSLGWALASGRLLLRWGLR